MHNYLKSKFLVKNIILESNNLIKLEDITNKVKILNGNIFRLDTNQISKEITALTNEIDHTEIQIIPPNTIVIRIEKRIPEAILVQQNRLFLIDKEGNIIKEINSSQTSGYILVYGKNSNFNYHKILSDIKNNTSYYNLIKSLHFIGERRWDINLQNSVVIKLPEEDVEMALKTLESFTKVTNPIGIPKIAVLRNGQNIENGNYNTIDLRIKGKIYIGRSSLHK